MLAVFLDLWTLVGGNGVFQGEFVQAEFLAQSGDGLAVGRLQFDPDEVVGADDVLADVVKRDRLDLGIVEQQTVDDGTWRIEKRWRILARIAERHPRLSDLPQGRLRAGPRRDDPSRRNPSGRMA
jgi:hypothetical protein